MTIPIMVTLDENYLSKLKVLLVSLSINNKDSNFDVYLVHSRISNEEINKIILYGNKLDINIYPIKVEENTFTNAPISDRYPKEMYYRLLASDILPDTLDKILYLDPDILVINSIEKLWNIDLGNYLFAAASHSGKTEMANNINHIRLKTTTDYFNSGILLINLKKCREKIDQNEIYEFVSYHSFGLILPDQDILNTVYSEDILQIDDAVWNYDARKYNSYMFRSNKKYDMEWVMNNTSIIHFCGREKPWNKNYRLRFGPLYKHYMVLANRVDTM